MTLPQTKPISATHSPTAIGAHLAPKAALSLTQIISKEGKYDYITSASTEKKKKKKAYGRLCSHVKRNQKGKCNISGEVPGFQGAVGRQTPRPDHGLLVSPRPDTWDTAPL